MTKMMFKRVKRSEFFALEAKVRSMETQIEEAKNFITEIEKGNLSIELKSNEGDDADSLAVYLQSMRTQMRKISEDEKQRNWATEGLARFVEILRTKNDNLKELAEAIIINVVKYMDANQGSLYAINDANPADIHLELIACYAYSRKKHLTQRIGLGEGLTGQVALEKASLYMTNLPDDYVKITSGLGEALPRNLLIVPLMLNGNVYGVIELASFGIFKEHHRQFIERLAESIASTLSSVRVNERTRKLLQETQAQAEQMRTQEEEMRQNMEELSATQEGMQRILKEMEGKEAYMTQLLNVSPDPIYTIDKAYKLVSWNTGLARSLEQFGMKMEKGVNTLDWFPASEHDQQIALYNRVWRGETFDLTSASEINGSQYYFLSIYAPLRNNEGEITEAAVFAKDVTTLTLTQKRAEQMLAESQHQTEELKAQEEELRQNMEELQATQDTMILKQEEIDRGRAENERIKHEEAERARKIAEMQKKTMLTATLKLKSKVDELQQVKSEMERVKQAEAQRAVQVAEMQKKTMLSVTQKLKNKINEQQQVIAEMQKAKA